MSLRCLYKRSLFIVIPVLLGALIYAIHPDPWQSYADGTASSYPTAQGIQEIVDNIRLISALPQKPGEPQWDKQAIQVTSLGPLAAPALAEKLDDESPSQVFDLFHYTIGDVALALLTDIYDPPGWPFPDGLRTIPRTHGDFRDYLEFVRTKDARASIKQSWQLYIRTH